MQKKKILFVINSLGCGGAEKSLISMLSVFDYERYDVSLQMFCSGGMFEKLLPEEVHVLPDLEYIKFCNKNLFQQLKNPPLLLIRIKTSLGIRCNRYRKYKLHDAQCYWKYAQRAFTELKDDYDVAIAWGQGNPTHFVSEKVSAKKKIAFINAEYEAVGYDKKFDYPFYEKMNDIITVSEKLQKKVMDTFFEMKEKISVIYDINHADLIEQMAALENPFIRCCDNKIKIVTVGRLVPQKGYDLLTKACKCLKDRGILFEWYVLGEGPERQNIEKDICRFGIEDCLFLQGARDNPYPYMKNADIYVQTSKFEGYCLTLGEARILNTPVISTNFDVVYNQLKNEENGLIVEMSGEAIADGIMRMLWDKELREKIKQNLRKEKKGNPEEVCKLYDRIEA